MSYSPARLDEVTPPETTPPAKIERAITPEPPTPSWFTPDRELAKPGHLADRYRERLAREQVMQKAQDEELEEYRRKLDEKFKAAKRLYDNPGNDNPPEVTLRARRPTLPRSTLDDIGARYMREAAPAAIAAVANAPKAPRAKRSHPIGTYAAYAVIAMVIGGAAGYGFANRTTLVNLASGTYDRARQVVTNMTQPLPDASAATASASSGTTTISKKTITMASLSVNDVSGTLNSMIPLALSATPADASRPVDVMISGLPASAYLTAGQQAADGSWIVKTPDVANLRLFVAQSETPKLDLEVAAVEQNSGQLAAPAQKMQVELSDVHITPVAAPPDGQTDNVQIKPTEASLAVASSKPAVGPLPAAPVPGSDLVARGDGLMGQGDVISARQYYLQAASLGNGRGAYGVARSYDPKVFAELKIEGLQPDPAKAADWYKKAAAAGVTSSQ
jgi:Sel1 repeat